MTAGTDLGPHGGLGRTQLDPIAAGTGNDCRTILGMDAIFHRFHLHKAAKLIDVHHYSIPVNPWQTVLKSV